MRIGILVIGDELLLGKRQDKHLPKMIEILGARGLRPDWARIVGDDPPLLETTLRDTLTAGDLVLSFGGIGATPDDVTRPCAAAAAGVALARHPEAAALIEARFGADAYPNRILMADLPQGARLIPNPVNQIPGFSLNDHHFLPGFPNMAWPMVAWVLDTHYRHRFQAQPVTECRVMVYGVAESALIPTMRELLAAFPGIKLASLPSATNSDEIELGVRGPAADVTPACAWLIARLGALGVRHVLGAGAGVP
jgi:molybdopterin-biosynthesis enzyme MoeA-like protein